MHINFSLRTIIPQHFQFICQMVQRWCSVWNVFEMILLALQAHVQAAREIVINMKAFLYEGCIGHGCN